MRTCSVKRPCIDRIYNVQVVIRVYPTPQRGTGVGKERGSHEGENLRDRVRGCKSLTLVPLVVSRVNSSNVIKWNSEPEKCYPTKRTIGSLLSLLFARQASENHSLVIQPVFPLSQILISAIVISLGLVYNK